MGRKKIAVTVLDPEHKTFVVHIASFNSTPLNIHIFCRPQIVYLIAKKVLIKISANYVNFIDVFSLYLASKLVKYTRINNYAIKLVDS